MNRIQTPVVALAVVAISVMISASAVEAGPQGSLSGTVTDRATGAPVENALIIILPMQDTTRTDAAGKFHFDPVPVGDYTIQVVHPDFDSFQATRILVLEGSGTFQTIELTAIQTVHRDLAREGGRKAHELNEIVAPDEVTVKKLDVTDQEVRIASPSLPSDVTQGLVRRPKANPATRGVPRPIEYDGLYPMPQPWPTDMFFREYGTNHFVLTSRDNLSTFAADVDDGSFDIARRYLGEGNLPPADAIRVEEFVNHFEYDLKPPRFTKFGVHTTLRRSPFDDSTSVLMIGIKGREIDRRERKPVNLTFVIDVSGSMGYDNRMEVVKYALGELVNELDRNDRVGIVTYGSGARVLLEPVSADRKRQIQTAIARLHPGGSTNAEAGLRLGYRMAEKQYIAGHSNRIILCSDGVANVGLISPEALAEEIQRRARQGITLSSFGVGMGNYNDVLLEQLAKHGNGRYAYINDHREAFEEMVVNFLGNVELLARDVKIQVAFNPKVVRSYRLLGYENRDVADHRFRDNRQDGGEIGVGHEVVALYEIVMTPHKRRGGKIGTISVRWKDDRGAEVAELEQPIDARLLKRRWDFPDDLRLALSAAKLAEKLKGTVYVRDLSWAQLRHFAAPVLEDDSREPTNELIQMIDSAERLSSYHTRRWEY